MCTFHCHCLSVIVFLSLICVNSVNSCGASAVVLCQLLPQSTREKYLGAMSLEFELRFHLEESEGGH